MDTGMILLVEDNPDDEELALRALRKHNFANPVIVMRDGVEALDFLFAQGRHSGRDLSVMPRLILLDVKLPRLNGLEVLQRLRADPRTRLLPVVMLSSSSEMADISGSYRRGANSYVRKPVDFNEFVELMEVLGRYWLIWNEPPTRVRGKA